jgi:hypothetical protein
MNNFYMRLRYHQNAENYYSYFETVVEFKYFRVRVKD